ncbi:MAG: hypothetical protein ACJ78Q_01240 [Chloroflexia bacterium]
MSSRRFTVDEYYRMAEVGILSEDDRVELIDGGIVQLEPIRAGHAACVDRLNYLLRRLVEDAALVSVQNRCTSAIFRSRSLTLPC